MKVSITKVANGFTCEVEDASDYDDGDLTSYAYEVRDDEDVHVGFASALRRLISDHYGDYFRSKRGGGLEVNVFDKGYESDEGLLGLDRIELNWISELLTPVVEELENTVEVTPKQRQLVLAARDLGLVGDD